MPSDIRRLPTGVIKTREMPRVNRSVIFWTVCPYLLSLDNPTCLYPIEGSEFRLKWLIYWCTMSMLMLTEVNTVVGLVLTQPGSILNASLLSSCPVVHWPHRLQHARAPCPSQSPGVCPSSRSLHQWCRPAITSSDALFSYCLQSFPASGTFPMSYLFTSDDHDTGASASTSVLPVKIQGWTPLRLTGLITLLSKGLSGTQHHSSKASILWFSAFFTVQLSQPYVTTGKTIALTIQTFVSRVMSPLFNTLSLSLH